jgi:hypothetical protein
MDSILRISTLETICSKFHAAPLAASLHRLSSQRLEYVRGFRFGHQLFTMALQQFTLAIERSLQERQVFLGHGNAQALKPRLHILIFVLCSHTLAPDL